MRLVYVTCLLLATTICCIADNNAGTTQGDTKTTNQQTEGLVTSAAPIENSISPVPPVNASVNAKTTNSNDTATSSVATIITTTTATNTSDNSHGAEVKNVTDIPKPNTILPTTLPTTKASEPPEKPTNATIVPPATAQSTVTITSPPATTTVPVPTKAAPSIPSPHKERHFDGLSFLGGIILATCLMAIGALSWKFYRTFNEQQYGTL